MQVYVNEIKTKLEKEVTKGKTIKQNRQMIMEIFDKYLEELKEEVEYSNLDIITYIDSSNYIGEISYGGYELIYEETVDSINLRINHPNYEEFKKEYYYREDGFLYSKEENESLDSELVSQECSNFIIQVVSTH